MSKLLPPACKTRNWPSGNEARKRRGSLPIWLDPAMTWQAAPTGKRGRQPDDSGSAIRTGLRMKGEGRPGNDPVDRFSPERTAPGPEIASVTADGRERRMRHPKVP